MTTSRSPLRPRGRIVAATAIGAAALGIATSGCSASHADTDDTATATVLRIVDGDTVDVVDDTRGRLRIRIIGLDTPETKKPGHAVACGGPEATEFARKALAGQRVAVITDPTQDLHDRYGRTLAYLVKAGNWDYSVEAARAGMGRAYVYQHSPPSVPRRSQPPKAKPGKHTEGSGARRATVTPNQHRCHKFVFTPSAG